MMSNATDLEVSNFCEKRADRRVQWPGGREELEHVSGGEDMGLIVFSLLAIKNLLNLDEAMPDNATLEQKIH